MAVNSVRVSAHSTLVLGWMMICASTAATGHGEIFARFNDGARQLRVAAYREPGPGTEEQRVGLVAIRAPAARVAVALDEDDLGVVLQLLKRAKAVQSPSWQVVGSVTESASSEGAELTLSAGPGLQVTISSSQRGGLSFTLHDEQIDDFERAILKMRDFLDARAIAVGFDPTLDHPAVGGRLLA